MGRRHGASEERRTWTGLDQERNERWQVQSDSELIAKTETKHFFFLIVFGVPILGIAIDFLFLFFNKI